MIGGLGDTLVIGKQGYGNPDDSSEATKRSNRKYQMEQLGSRFKW